MRTENELFAAHLCGWVQATLASDTATAPTLSRRQVLNGLGVLTAAALLSACTQQSNPPAPQAPGARPPVERRW